MEPKPEEDVPGEPEHGEKDAQLNDLENTVGGRARPVYSIVGVDEDK